LATQIGIFRDNSKQRDFEKKRCKLYLYLFLPRWWFNNENVQILDSAMVFLFVIFGSKSSAARKCLGTGAGH